VKQIWFDSYDPHVPPKLDYPQITLPVALDQTVENHPDHPFIIFKGSVFSYQETQSAILHFAAALQELGLKTGDRVAIHLPNCPQFIIAYFAILRLGAIAVPSNPIYTASELTHQLNDSGSTCVITLSNTYSILKDIRSQTPLEHVIVAKIKTYLPTHLRILFGLLLENRYGHKVDITSNDRTYWFQDLLNQDKQLVKPIDVASSDTAVLMYTGGTTGTPRAAQLTHRNIMTNAFQVRVWADVLERPARVLAALPLFHSYGMTTCMNAGALAPGTIILVPDPRDIDDLLKTIHRQRPQLFPGVPAMYSALSNHPAIDQYDLSSIETCISGAAPLPPEIQRQFQEITGARLVEGYGLSEASPISHSNPIYGPDRIGTIGLPWPDTDVKIVDTATGDLILEPGVPGEMCIRGPQVMAGYWNRPGETADVLRPAEDSGLPWLFTGDIASMDEDGYFRIVDRKKDVILGAGGLNIFPREIEDLLYTHSQIAEAAVAGVHVEGKGERVKAFVVLMPGETCTSDQILAFCRQKLAPYKVPKFVEFRDQLPKNQVGKVLRRQLVADSESMIG